MVPWRAFHEKLHHWDWDMKGGVLRLPQYHASMQLTEVITSCICEWASAAAAAAAAEWSSGWHAPLITLH